MSGNSAVGPEAVIHPLIARKAKKNTSWNVIGGSPLLAALRRRDLFPGNQCYRFIFTF